MTNIKLTLVLQRALLEVHRRLLEGDYSMAAGSTAPVVTRFLVNQIQANNLLQRSACWPERATLRACLYMYNLLHTLVGRSFPMPFRLGSLQIDERLPVLTCACSP